MNSSIKLLNSSRRMANKRIARCFYHVSTSGDTIFAPSTEINRLKGSPLGVIRVSGPQTQNVLKTITGKKFEEPRLAKLAKFYTPNTKDLIDIGIVLWFPKPHSYTGEDVCEFHLHGSVAVMSKMLDILGSFPHMRPSEPGEFTRRAVINKKMSLIEAESLPDLIGSKTDKQRKLALEGLSGSTRDKYQKWISDLLTILAHLEASIDFGEDELIGEQKVVNECIYKLKSLATELSKYMSISARCRNFIKSGFNLVILGKPNAGKSTLMNVLSGRDKSIVSDLSGTTRDVVEHSLELEGHYVTLSDTAGIETERQIEESTEENFAIKKHLAIEREGMRRAYEAGRSADLIIYLLNAQDLIDNNGNISEITRELNSALDNIRRLSDNSTQPNAMHLVINKIDLTGDSIKTIIADDLERELGNELNLKVTSSCVSCKTGENIASLINGISRHLNHIERQMSSEKELLESRDKCLKFDYVNERHLSLLRSCLRHLESASNMNISTIDQMAQHVRESVDYLSRIVGSVSNEQVFDIIFRDFCIGK